MFDRAFSGALGPHFAHLRQIGGGGDGLVFSGVDIRFDFPVCIKRLSVTNKNDCRAALREIRIRRRLRHENIVGLLNVITSDGTDVSEIAPANFRDTSCIYLVQELLDADLHQVIESNNRLIDDYVKLFFYQLLRGLKYIHSANVLHRDLKPSNVVIKVNSLELMIGDFGHSMVLDPDYNHSNCLSSCGTSLWYKAPELILGSSRNSTASDMWSVGCILAEMLLGRPLFEGENDLEQLELIIHTIEVNERDQLRVRHFLTEEVNEMYTGKPKFPLRSKFQKVDFHALHLLERLLAFNPVDRVTAELALSHPFLHEYSCTADEPLCSKPLHLEHEVDDFLENTLKDLIVGECVALAEEQPRIQTQMSSYSSLMDIVKELNDSPTEAIPQSVEDGKAAISVKVTSDNERATPNDGGDGRFKVLEVLREEHQSSSDSNGIPSHEDGVSEEPLVSDHPTFSSLKWENERHKYGHRRHHSHHRRKSSGEESSRSRKRKISPGSKAHKSPNTECEISEGRIPCVLSPEENLSGGPSSDPSSSSDSRLSPGEQLRVRNSDLDSEPVISDEALVDKVKELIVKSHQTVADHPFQGEVLERLRDGSTDHVCSGLGNSNVEKEFGGDVIPARELQCIANNSDYSSSEEKETLEKSQEDELYHAADASVADLIRRTHELLGEGNSAARTEERKEVVEDMNDPVKDLILKSKQLLGEEAKVHSETIADDTKFDRTVEHMKENSPHSITESSTAITLQPSLSDPYQLKESNRRMQELLQESHTLLSNLQIDQEPNTNLEIGSLQLHEGESRRSLDKPPANLDVSAENLPSYKTVCPVREKELAVPNSSEDNSNDHCVSQFKTSGPDIDLDEMRAVLNQAKQLLDHPVPCPTAKAGGLVSGPLNHKNATVTPTEGSEVQKDVKLAEVVQQNAEGELGSNEIVVQEDNICKSDVNRLSTVAISQCKNHVSYCRVSPQDLREYPCTFDQQASLLEPVTVKHSAEYADQILVKKSSLHSRDREEEEELTNGRSLKFSVTNAGDEEGVRAVINDDISKAEQRSFDETETTQNNDETKEDNHVEEQSRETSVISSNFSPKNALIHHVPNGFSYKEINILQNTKCQEFAPKVASVKLNNGIIRPSNISFSSKYGCDTSKEDAPLEKQLKDVMNVTRGCREDYHSKDDAGLKNFYATIKIKSLMNRSRTYRDKLHEPYPF